MSTQSAPVASTARSTARAAVSPMAQAARALGSLVLSSQQAQPTAVMAQASNSVLHSRANSSAAAAAASAAVAATKPLLGGPHGEHKHAGHRRDRDDPDMSHHRDYFHAKRHRGEHGRSRAGLSDGGEHTKGTAFRSFIKADAQAKAYVTRSYQSNTYIWSNTTGNDNTGKAFSLRLEFAGGAGGLSAKIIEGGPATGTDTGLVFGNLLEESTWFLNVFRYVKIKKLQINITRMPQQVMMGTNTISDGAGGSAVVQNGYQSNMLDPGYIVLRPWAGEPGVASYLDGDLSSEEWADYVRHKEKVIRPAASEHGAQSIMRMCVQPLSVVDLPEDANDGTTDVQYKYTPTPAADINRLRTASVNLNSYGIIFWWYYPASSGAVSGAFRLPITFEIELAFYGLDIPTGIGEPALPDGTVYADDLAAEFRDDVKVVPRPKQKQKALAVDANNTDDMDDAVVVTRPK